MHKESFVWWQLFRDLQYFACAISADCLHKTIKWRTDWEGREYGTKNIGLPVTVLRDNRAPCSRDAKFSVMCIWVAAQLLLISNPELPPHWQLVSSMCSCRSALRPTTAAETRVGPDTDVCLSPHLLDWQYLLTYSHFQGLETMIERNICIVNIMINAWFTWALNLKLSFWRQQDLKLYCLLPIHLFHTPLRSNHPTKSGLATQSLVKTKSSSKDI